MNRLAAASVALLPAAFLQALGLDAGELPPRQAVRLADNKLEAYRYANLRPKGIEKPVVASLAGDVEVEEAAEYLYQHGIPAYAYSTEIPVAVLGAKYQWARGARLISAT